MTHPTLLHLQRYHEAAPRHGDLTGQIRARQLAELRDREAAERRETERREREELEAAEANDPDTVVDLPHPSSAPRTPSCAVNGAIRMGCWDDQRPRDLLRPARLLTTSARPDRWIRRDASAVHVARAGQVPNSDRC